VSQTVQLRPEFAGHPAQLDVRVRRALAHSLDRQAINDGVFEGQGFMTETIVPTDVPYFAEVDRAVSKYPYDPRRTEQLMAEAGFTKDRQGLFANAAGVPYRLDFRTFAGPEFERIQAILSDAWRRSGVDVNQDVLPAAQVRDRQTAHTFPGIATRGGGLNEQTWTTAEIGAPENRWAGNNRAGWSNAEYDRLWEAFNTMLDRTERTQQFIQMQRLLAEHLPVFITYFSIQVNTHAAALVGPEAGTGGAGTLTRGTLSNWNVHEWHWQ
jgi:peptide/nickel transport system substrate-binding protein